MAAQLYDNPILESRLDWLTITAAGTQERLDLADVAANIVAAESLKGDNPRPWTHQGYSGFGTQHVHYGTRPDTDILTLGSTLADDYLATVLPYASNVSRLDTCVTVRTPEPGDNVIVEGYDSGRAYPFRGGHRPTYELLQHSRRGTTLYVGSRSSRFFGRLYNKHRESELAYYAGCLRYEVEQKGSVAVDRARLLAADSHRGDSIASSVYAFFEQRGIEPRFDPGGRRVYSQPFRPHSDNQRRLLWLSGQVRKTIDTLVRAGLRDQALFALGLDDSHQTLDGGPVRAI